MPALSSDRGADRTENQRENWD